MTTNTAAKICVLIKVIAMVAGISLIWILPESLHCPKSLDFCENFQPWRLWLNTPPFLLALIIILVVIVFTMYRAHSFREVHVSSLPLDGMEMEERQHSTQETETDNNFSSPDTVLRLSPTQLKVQKDNVFVAGAETVRNAGEEGETISIALRNYPMICPVPPLTSLLDIIYKYLRVTLLSLCILVGNLTDHIMIITNFSSNSGQCCHEK